MLILYYVGPRKAGEMSRSREFSEQNSIVQFQRENNALSQNYPPCIIDRFMAFDLSILQLPCLTRALSQSGARAQVDLRDFAKPDGTHYGLMRLEDRAAFVLNLSLRETHRAWLKDLFSLPDNLCIIIERVESIRWMVNSGGYHLPYYQYHCKQAHNDENCPPLLRDCDIRYLNPDGSTNPNTYIRIGERTKENCADMLHRLLRDEDPLFRLGGSVDQIQPRKKVEQRQETPSQPALASQPSSGAGTVAGYVTSAVTNFFKKFTKP